MDDDFGQSEVEMFARDVIKLETQLEPLSRERDIYRDMLQASLELLNRAAVIIGNQQTQLSELRERVHHR